MWGTCSVYNTGCIKLLGDGHSFLGGDSQLSGGEFFHLDRVHRKWAPFRLRLIVDVRYARHRTGQTLLTRETERQTESEEVGVSARGRENCEYSRKKISSILLNQ